jgi:3-methyl-2-oxobutanoate hydroxymethyltransferase
MITAYDYPSAKHAEYADVDIVLVGDSVGMVVLGWGIWWSSLLMYIYIRYDTTQPVTMDDMIYHCRAVRRGAPNRFIVGDMPFGSYEVLARWLLSRLISLLAFALSLSLLSSWKESPEFALKNALRFIKESGVDCVKLEGGEIRAPTVKKLVESGIAVMGHVGLTPQGVGVLGGFRAQGRTAVKARQILNDAMALQRAGAFGLVIECVPEIVAKAVTESLKVQSWA